MSERTLFEILATPVVAFALCAALAAGGTAQAEVKPGDLINSDNASKVKDLVAPGVYYKVERGMQMKIVPTSRIDWPPPYKDATEKYSGQVRLSDDHRTVLGYVAGQTVDIDYRYAEGDTERLRPLARELMALAPDVMFAGEPSAAK